MAVDFTSLQLDSKRIAKLLNEDPDLARAAMVNPVLALAELGYELEPDARATLEDRARFSKRDAARRAKLRKDMHKAVGGAFDPDDEAALETLLFEQLELDRKVGQRPYLRRLKPRPRTVAIAIPKDVETAAKLVKQSARKAAKAAVKAKRVAPGLVEPEAVDDPLEVLRDAHAVMPPLLEYRRIDALAPAFGSAEAYAAARAGRGPAAAVRPFAIVTGGVRLDTGD